MKYKIAKVDLRFKRYLYSQINWKARIISIKGVRVIGKTFEQIADVPDSYLAVDDTEVGSRLPDSALAVRFPVLGDDTSVTTPLAGYSICSLSNLQVLLALSFRLVVMSRTAHSKDPALLLDAVAVESIMPCVDAAVGST